MDGTTVTLPHGDLATISIVGTYEFTVQANDQSRGSLDDQENFTVVVA